jgi:hypothetical protein
LPGSSAPPGLPGSSAPPGVSTPTGANNPPSLLAPQTNPSPAGRDARVCCVYLQSNPADPRAPGSDPNFTNHAQNFDFKGAGCTDVIGCRTRVKADGSSFELTDCFSVKGGTPNGLLPGNGLPYPRPGGLFNSNPNNLRGTLDALGCKQMGAVMLHHSDDQLGFLDLQAIVNSLPVNPGGDINAVVALLGCNSLTNRPKFCQAASQLADKFKKIERNCGRVTLTIVGTIYYTFIHTQLQCTWENPTGGSINNSKVRKIKMSPDGFTVCKKDPSDPSGRRWIVDTTPCGPNERPPRNFISNPRGDLMC